MNRRYFLIKSVMFTLLAGISTNSCVEENSAPLVLKSELGKLDRKKLIFLLRRCTTGFTIEQLHSFKDLSLKEILNKLFNTQTHYTLPINFEFKEDRLVPIGQTWIKAPYRTDVFYEQYRKKSLRAWLISFTHNNPCSIRQQMMYFWLNYYSISDVLEHKYEYKHLLYLHDNAFGNFKQITLDITLDPAMLRFLSGFENTKENPNENYARELLELFTVGRGDMVGKGDYTTFTEQDVSIIAKALSGWTDKGWFTEDITKEIGIEFKKDNHDFSKKELSNRFENAEIENTGEEEYRGVIELIFSKQETAIHFTKRLYRWFCADEITAEAEKNLILPLSKLLMENNYEIKPVVEAMLSSEYFYALSSSSQRIKNPIQYTFDLLHFFPTTTTNNLVENYGFYFDVFDSVTKMGMELLKPPSVGGWKAYYQAPGFSKLWINSAALKNKKVLVNKLTGEVDSWDQWNVKVDYRKLIQQTNTKTVAELIDFLNEFYFSSNLDTTIKKQIKSQINQDEEKELIEKVVAEDETAIRSLNRMLNHTFNLPFLNIH